MVCTLKQGLAWWLRPGSLVTEDVEARELGLQLGENVSGINWAGDIT